MPGEHRPDAAPSDASDFDDDIPTQPGEPPTNPGYRRRGIRYVNPAHSGECNAPGACAGCDDLDKATGAG